MNTAAGNYEPEQIPARTEMASLVEIKSRLAAIEQGQGALLAGIDAVGDANRIESKERYENLMRLIGFQWDSLSKKLDCLQGKELLSQFKANGHKPKRRRK